MVEEYIDEILFFLGSASFGNLFGILRSKMLSGALYSSLWYIFLILSIFSILSSLFGICLYWQEIVADPTDVGRIGSLLFPLLTGGTLMLYVVFCLQRKEIYKSSELTNKINEWTNDAHNSEIRLLAGDLDFLGKTPKEILRNSQFIELRAKGFKKVMVLCTKPEYSTDKIRYGKILLEIPQMELRFYKPENADLQFRGRIKKKGNVEEVLIYKKIKSGIYEFIPTNTGKAEGGLFSDFWKLAWGIAEEPKKELLESYKLLLKSE